MADVNKIKGSQLENATITGAKIANATIAGAKLVTETVTATQVANDSLTGEKSATAYTYSSSSTNGTWAISAGGCRAFRSTNTTGVTVNLPSSNATAGRQLAIWNDGAGNMTVNPAGGGTINGASSLTVPPTGEIILTLIAANTWIATFLRSVPATQLRQSLTPAEVETSATIQPMTATRIVDTEGEPALSLVAADTCPGATIGLHNAAPGAATITPASGTINGAGSYELAVGAKAWLWSDGGTDWNLIGG